MRDGAISEQLFHIINRRFLVETLDRQEIQGIMAKIYAADDQDFLTDYFEVVSDYQDYNIINFVNELDDLLRLIQVVADVKFISRNVIEVCEYYRYSDVSVSVYRIFDGKEDRIHTLTNYKGNQTVYEKEGHPSSRKTFENEEEAFEFLKSRGGS